MSIFEEREAITLINQGQKIFGILHRPVSQTKVPAILICPGFAGNKCGKYRLFVIIAEQLAKLGFAVLRFDYRGSGDSEGHFQELTIEGKISDTITCLNFLKQEPFIDPNRIGILGRSLGGLIAVLAAKRSSLVKSLVLWAPVFHSLPWQRLWNQFRQEKAGQLSELPPNIPNIQFLEEFFTVDLKKELEGLRDLPLLHIHGKLDTVVEMDHAKEYEQTRQGIAHSRFIQLPNSDHDFSNFPEQKIAIMETCNWFQQTL